MYLLKQQFFKKKGTRKYFGQSNGSANDFTGMLTAGPVLGVAFSLVFSHCQLLITSCSESLPSHLQQGGAQISLAEVCRSGEKSTRWYNLLSYKYLKKQSREPKPVGAMGPALGPENTVSREGGGQGPPTQAAPGQLEGRAISWTRESEHQGCRKGWRDGGMEGGCCLWGGASGLLIPRLYLALPHIVCLMEI